MTYEIESDAPERVRHEAAQLHELAVNQFGYDTEHVLFTAHADGTISGRIALYVASDYQDSENDSDDDPDRNGSVEDEATEGSPLNAWNDVSSDQDRDPDPPGIGITVSRPSTNPKTDRAEAGT